MTIGDTRKITMICSENYPIEIYEYETKDDLFKGAIKDLPEDLNEYEIKLMKSFIDPLRLVFYVRKEN